MSIYFCYAQTSLPIKKTQWGFGQLDFLSIAMPNDEAHMDFAGIHYNIKPTSWSYVGTGFYGAVDGIRGGFFTLGVNAGIQPKLTNNLFIDAGVHFGGGGGAAAPDGGGAFLLPHIGLGYTFKRISATVGWSHINFFDKGAIHSNQLYAQVQIPLHFNYTAFTAREMSFSLNDLQHSVWHQKASRIGLIIHTDNLKIISQSQPKLNNKTIHLAGFELNSYLSNKWFFFFRADGAYHGIQAGYMDLFIGGGYRLSINKNRTNILTKFGVGAGGGGGVDTKGGFLIYPDISLEQQLFKRMYASINKGYLMTPDGHFKTSTLGFGITYYVDKNGTISENHAFTKGIFKGIETIIQQELYTNSNRNRGFSKNMQQIGLQINLFLNKYIYGAGQTSFANFGDAGAYAEGIVGIGIQSQSFLNDRCSVYGQILGGAAGGGGIGTGQGLIVKPSIGLTYQLTEKLNLRSSLGYVKANGGNLSNTFISLGIGYRFSVLSVR